MEFRNLDTRRGAEQGCEVRLRDPATGAPLEAWITVLGHDSSAYQQHQNDRARRWARMLQKDRNRSMSPEEVKEAAREMIAAVTVKWRGIELDGKKLECTPEAAAKFYAEFPWVVDQLDEAVHDRGNFLPANAKP